MSVHSVHQGLLEPQAPRCAVQRFSYSGFCWFSQTATPATQYRGSGPGLLHTVYARQGTQANKHSSTPGLRWLFPLTQYIAAHRLIG